MVPKFLSLTSLMDILSGSQHITLYTKHGNVSRLISCCCWDERRQWSQSSCLKTPSDVSLTSYNKHIWHVCSWIVDLWWCTSLIEFCHLVLVRVQYTYPLLLHESCCIAEREVWEIRKYENSLLHVASVINAMLCIAYLWVIFFQNCTLLYR